MGSTSDFAQKLLHDLRLRKEKMATAQNSSQMSREFHANAAAYRYAQPVTALEPGRRPNRGSRSFDLSESSNQIILKNSMALFSAFENTQKLNKISPPRTNPLINFFTRLSRRPVSCTKTDTDPNHVTGIEKLNQILQSCSNHNHGFNRNSIDLEESLRMLVDLQEASEYINGPRPETCLRLFGETKDDREGLELTHKKILVEPPKFSFDKSKHKRSTSCIPDFDSARKAKVKNEKGRISNVVAKLMGIEELPHKEENTSNKNLSSSKGKERKVLSNIETDVKDLNPGIRAEKREPETRQIPKEMKLLEIQNAKGSEERSTLKEDKERKITELNNEMKQKVHQDSMILLAEEEETGNANKGLELKRKHPPRARVPKKRDVLEDMHRGGQKGNKKHKDHHEESLSLLKTREKNEKSTPEKGTTIRMDGEAATKNGDPTIIKECRNENLPPRKQWAEVEKTIDVSSGVKSRSVRKENHKNENTRKMDLQMIRKSTENVNRLTRSLKQSADMLQDLKQQMQKKRTDEQSERSEMSILKSDAVIEITKKDESPDERHTKNKQKVLAPKNNCNDIDSNPRNVSYDHQKTKEPCSSSISDQEIRQSNLSIGGRNPTFISENQLTEREKELKEIVIKSQEFINTAKALFKLNNPDLTLLHTGDDHTDKLKNEKLILDCAYEIMKRKAKRTNYSPFQTGKAITTLASPKLRSLDDPIKLLSKDIETLTFHDEEGDIVGHLCNLLENDVYDKVPDANCMWDSEWGDMKLMFSERDDVVRDLEKHVLNVLLNEITNDMLEIVVS